MYERYTEHQQCRHVNNTSCNETWLRGSQTGKLYNMCTVKNINKKVTTGGKMVWPSD